MTAYELQEYETGAGRVPFRDWIQSLRDETARFRIRTRLDRMQLGHFGDCKPVGQGVFEARFHFGPGYRVYFSHRGNKLIILFCGGDKDSQQRDIQTAHAYWWDYKRRNDL